MVASEGVVVVIAPGRCHDRDLPINTTHQNKPILYICDAYITDT